jgi:hypothetical protein
MYRRASASTIEHVSNSRVSENRSQSNPELNNLSQKQNKCKNFAIPVPKRNFHLKNPFKFRKKAKECREEVQQEQSSAKANSVCTEISLDGDAQVANLQVTIDNMKTAMVKYTEQLQERGPNLENLQASCIKLTERTKELELTARVVKKKKMNLIQSLKKHPFLFSGVFVLIIFLTSLRSIISN